MTRILDLTHYVAGPFATLLLAELGADVIKVERPDGDPWRRLCAAEDEGAGFDYLNRRKRSVTLDLRSGSGRHSLLELAAGADAVVENFRPRTLGRLRLSFAALRRANPSIVLTSISNYGQRGPRRDWQASELVLQATGGIVHGTGWEGEPPQKLGGHAAEHAAGLNAAIATLASIHGVVAGTESAVHNDVSIQESFAAHWARQISQWVYSGTGTRRQQRGSGAQGFPPTQMAADGWLYVLALRAEWEAFAYFLGLEQFIGSEWSDPTVRRERWAEIDPHFRAAIASRGRYDWFAAAAEQGYTFAPSDDARSVLGSPQLAARGFFDEAELRDGSRARVPGLPVSGFEPPEAPNRVPRLGEHNQLLASEHPWLAARAGAHRGTVSSKGGDLI